jgi:hypothetical protein
MPARPTAITGLTGLWTERLSALARGMAGEVDIGAAAGVDAAGVDAAGVAVAGVAVAGVVVAGVAVAGVVVAAMAVATRVEDFMEVVFAVEVGSTEAVASTAVAGSMVEVAFMGAVASTAVVDSMEAAGTDKNRPQLACRTAGSTALPAVFF